ncbi:MAG: palindromic element RPE2 domain-containing protein [Rickettsia endosymbiont of Pseudomimeciton antennatum]|nr:palindromic element RPE2 domain-containing protein [Rickettsia endosymbiont of Pseudomimeciton antennatum]
MHSIFLLLYIVNSGEFRARNDGAMPISNRRATSDNVTNFSSIDYIIFFLH